MFSQRAANNASEEERMAELRPITALLDDPSPISRQHGVLLLVIKGPDRGDSIVIDKPVTIGTNSECGLVLTDGTVSAVHAEIRIEDDEILVVDRGSTNGCVIGGARIERAVVGFGTELKLGRSVIKIVPDEQFVAPSPSIETSFGTLVGANERMRQMFTLLADAAPTNATVLIEGETGTGKELIAEELHRHSARRDGPFIVFDCSSVPRELVASILFGHVKGAFTNAMSDRKGVFAEAHGGTLFLDEIGEMLLDLQPALLRALDKRAVCRVGATTFDKVDVRVVAATNRDLRAEIAAKRFREDLFYRLAVIRLEVPPLRARGSDIALLVEHFREKFGAAGALDPDDLARLVRHGWPGNVRELRNVIERACVLGDLERALDVQTTVDRAPRTDLPFKEAKHQVVEAFEREYIEALVARHGSLSAAAREAQIDRKHFRELMRKYGLSAT
jgi:two-component system nitrogen regulation response regulator GlnG